MDKNQVKKSFKDTFDKARAAREKGEPIVKSVGSFQDVLDSFVDFLNETDHIEASLLAGAGPDTHRIRIWPQYMPTMATTLMTLWYQRNGDNETMSVLGSREIVFTDPEKLRVYLNELLGTTLYDTIGELKHFAQQDVDAMLRTGRSDRLPNEDMSVVITNAEFLQLAKAASGARLELKATITYPQRFDANRLYQRLTAYGHTLEIDSSGVKPESSATIVVTGIKQGGQKLAA